jgi:hypothetical protein
VTVEEFNAQSIDSKSLCPFVIDGEGRRTDLHQRSEYLVGEVLAANDGFAVGRTAAGKFVCLWPGHVDLFDSLDALRASLNVAEKPLLP